MEWSANVLSNEVVWSPVDVVVPTTGSVTLEAGSAISIATLSGLGGKAAFGAGSTSDSSISDSRVDDGCSSDVCPV